MLAARTRRSHQSLLAEATAELVAKYCTTSNLAGDGVQVCILTGCIADLRLQSAEEDERHVHCEGLAESIDFHSC